MKKLIICLITILVSNAHAQNLNLDALVFGDFSKEEPDSLWTDTPGKSISTGYLCYFGDKNVKLEKDSIVYRLKSYKLPKKNVYVFRITGYHLSGKNILKDPTERTPEVDLPREVTCKGKIIDSVYKGHESTIQFLVTPTEGKVIPTFDVTLTDSAGDLEILTKNLAPIFNEFKASSSSWYFNIRFLDSDYYKGVDNSDSVAIIMAAMKQANALGNRLAETLPIFTLSDSL